jgi:rubredoxin
MEEPKYKIGEVVYAARFTMVEEWITCPDCGGTKTLKFIMFDGTEHLIDCSGCSLGYDPPTGTICIHTRSPKVDPVQINNIQADGDGFKYNWTPEDQLFANRERAFAKAVEIAAEEDLKDSDRINNKEKPARTWSWHVHYYRKQIRDAKKRIEFAEARLNVALNKSKAKEA